MIRLYLIFGFIAKDLIRNISGPLGIRLRRAYYKKRFKKCGSNLRIETGVYIIKPQYVSIGDNVLIDKRCTLIAGKKDEIKNCIELTNGGPKLYYGEIIIGSNSHIGMHSVLQGHGGIVIEENFTCSSNASIYSMSNDPTKCKKGTLPGDSTFYIISPIIIGKNVWFGLNVSCLGSAIGDNVFVGANSLIKGVLNKNSIYQGTPAKYVKTRFTE